MPVNAACFRETLWDTWCAPSLLGKQAGMMAPAGQQHPTHPLRTQPPCPGSLAAYNYLQCTWALWAPGPGDQAGRGSSWKGTRESSSQQGLSPPPPSEGLWRAAPGNGSGQSLQTYSILPAPGPPTSPISMHHPQQPFTCCPLLLQQSTNCSPWPPSL